MKKEKGQFTKTATIRWQKQTLKLMIAKKLYNHKKGNGYHVFKPVKNVNDFVNQAVREKIMRDKNPRVQEDLLKKELVRLQEERDEMNDEIERVAEDLRSVKKKVSGGGVTHG